MQLIFAAQPIFMAQRDLFRRDYASKFYSWAPFSFGMNLVDVPYLFLLSTLSISIAFYVIGLNSSPINNFYFWLAFVLFIFFSVSFGQLVS